jgi:hypothetical protein
MSVTGIAWPCGRISTRGVDTKSPGPDVIVTLVSAHVQPNGGSIEVIVMSCGVNTVNADGSVSVQPSGLLTVMP